LAVRWRGKRVLPGRGADELEPRVVGEELPDDLGSVDVAADPPDDGSGEILRASRPGVAASINPVQRNHRMLRALEVSGRLYRGPVRGVGIGELHDDRMFLAVIGRHPLANDGVGADRLPPVPYDRTAPVRHQ